MNFFKIENQNIKLDNVISFRMDDEHLLIYTDTMGQPFAFYDPDLKLYTALCNHVYGERKDNDND